MIYIGTDIIDVDRIRSAILKGGQPFLKKVFTLVEIEYCKQRPNPYMHYAGRFAAKESVKKALLSMNADLIIPLNDIQIENRPDGAPIASLLNIELKIGNLQVSISHTESQATGMALLEVK